MQVSLEEETGFLYRLIVQLIYCSAKRFLLLLDP